LKTRVEVVSGNTYYSKSWECPTELKLARMFGKMREDLETLPAKTMSIETVTGWVFFRPEHISAVEIILEKGDTGWLEAQR